MALLDLLSFHRPWVLFPESPSGSFQLPVVPASENLMLSSGQQALHSHVQNHTHTHIN